MGTGPFRVFLIGVQMGTDFLVNLRAGPFIRLLPILVSPDSLTPTFRPFQSLLLSVPTRIIIDLDPAVFLSDQIRLLRPMVSFGHQFPFIILEFFDVVHQLAGCFALEILGVTFWISTTPSLGDLSLDILHLYLFGISRFGGI